MEHVVFFPGPDGAPAFRRFTTQDEAVRFVEHLRNAEGVSEVSMHELRPVPVAFRTYYRAEVPSAEATPTEALPAEALPADAPPADMVAESAAPAPVVEPDAADAPPAAEAAVAALAEALPGAEALPVAEAGRVVVGVAAGEPSANGNRSMGFFAD